MEKGKKITITIPEDMLEKMAIITGYPLSAFYKEADDAGALLTAGLVALYASHGVEMGYRECVKEVEHKTLEQMPWPVRGE